VILGLIDSLTMETNQTIQRVFSGFNLYRVGAVNLLKIRVFRQFRLGLLWQKPEKKPQFAVVLKVSPVKRFDC
jgi:hypothetical protein